MPLVLCKERSENESSMDHRNHVDPLGRKQPDYTFFQKMGDALGI